MFRDRLHEALRLAEAPTLERIRSDCQRLPHRLAKLLAYVAEHLCDPDLNVTSARRATGIGDHSLSTVFRAHTGTTLRAYIEQARLEIADRLVRRTDFEIGRIGFAVGYSAHATFLRAYKVWAGERPSDARGEPRAPEIDYPTWRRTWYGKLDAEEARDYLAKYRRLYPEADQPERETPDCQQAPARIVVDGGSFERFHAEQLWQEIRALAPAAQRRRVREHLFHSPALFDLLRRRSREEGRRDRRRGVAIAELALVSLEGGEEVFGDRIHELRALGWAWLGNARRLALDFPAAGAAFERAEAERCLPSARPDHNVLARIHDLEASLRVCQRNYGEALRLVERSRALFRLAEDPVGEARVLIQRATIHCYEGNPEQSIETLGEAASLIEKQDEPHLSFVIFGNLANDQAKVGRYRDAAESLDRARSHCGRLDLPLGWLEIQWVAGFIQQGAGDLLAAQESYAAARGGFVEAGELCSVGLISLELAILFARQDAWSEVIAAASEAAPNLGGLSLYPETLAAVTLLSEALRAGEVSASLLREVRDRVQQDPLVRLQQGEGRRKPRPSPG